MPGIWHCTRQRLQARAIRRTCYWQPTSTLHTSCTMGYRVCGLECLLGKGCRMSAPLLVAVGASGYWERWICAGDPNPEAVMQRKGHADLQGYGPRLTCRLVLPRGAGAPSGLSLGSKLSSQTAITSSAFFFRIRLNTLQPFGAMGCQAAWHDIVSLTLSYDCRLAAGSILCMGIWHHHGAAWMVGWGYCPLGFGSSSGRRVSMATQGQAVPVPQAETFTKESAQCRDISSNAPRTHTLSLPPFPQCLLNAQLSLALALPIFALRDFYEWAQLPLQCLYISLQCPPPPQMHPSAPQNQPLSVLRGCVCVR